MLNLRDYIKRWDKYMNIQDESTKEKLHNIFAEADKKREISRFILDVLYKNAKERQLVSKWAVSVEKANDTGWYNSQLTNPIAYYHVQITVSSEDYKYKTEKHYILNENWQEEKQILIELSNFLLTKMERIMTGK